MHLFQTYNLHHINRRLDHADFWLFEISVWLHTMALSMMSVFIPIFLLESGFSLSLVITYYVIAYGVNVPISFIAPKLINRIGARLVIALSTVCIIGYVSVLLVVTPAQVGLILLLAFLGAMYDAFFWVSHLYIFVQSNNREEVSDRNTSILFSGRRVAGVLGPVVGAVVLVFAGEPTLLVVTIVMFVFSLVPLLRVDDYEDRPRKNITPFRSFLSNETDIVNYISSALFSIHKVGEFVIWPLFIYLTFQTIQSVAFVPIIISSTAVFFSFFIKRFSFVIREKLIIIGALLASFVWLLRIYIEVPEFYFLSILLGGLFMLVIGVPLDGSIFARARHSDALAACTYRNVFNMSAGFGFFVILFFTVNIFKVSFVTASISLFALFAVNLFFLLRVSKMIKKQEVPV